MRPEPILHAGDADILASAQESTAQPGQRGERLEPASSTTYSDLVGELSREGRAAARAAEP